MSTPTSPGKPGLSVSPLAVALPEFGRIAGVRLAVGRAGFYKHERPDVLLMAFDAVSYTHLTLPTNREV